jgi:8-oxo-dGTP diphosphatase
MAKICDHTSVGMFVWKEGKLLLIERRKFPPGFAVPAGHVDGDDTYEEAAKRELKEEVGLDAVKLELVYEGRRENPCRREGGTWHHWKIYKVEAAGEVKRSEEETKQAGWYSVEEMRAMYDKIEPVWQVLFKELKVL